MPNDNNLEELDRKLKAVRGEEDKENTARAEKMRDGENMSNGVRAGMELVSAIAAGGLIGFLLDNWLETKPLFLIAMLVLGVATGFYNVYRISMNMGSAVGFRELHEREKNAKNALNEKES